MCSQNCPPEIIEFASLPLPPEEKMTYIENRKPLLKGTLLLLKGTLPFTLPTAG